MILQFVEILILGICFLACQTICILILEKATYLIICPFTPHFPATISGLTLNFLQQDYDIISHGALDR
jgi:hypothetical protein